MEGQINVENVENQNTEEEKKPKRNKNDIKWIKSIRQFERYEFDLDSPRFVEACQKLGILPSECKAK